MNNNRQGASAQTVSRAEYLSLDNRGLTAQQRWPAREINEWVGLLQEKRQSWPAPSCAAVTLGPHS